MPFTPLFGNLALDPLDQTLSEFMTACHFQKQHDALIRILGPALADNNAIRDLWKVGLDDTVYIRRPKADARRIQDAVGTAEKEDLTREGMHLDEVAVGPDVGKARIIGSFVLFARGVVAPKANGLVGKRSGGDKLARDTVCNCFARAATWDQGIVDFDFCA